jgi:hypothetical protein
MPKEVKSLNWKICKKRSNHFFRIFFVSPYLQYYGEDCSALAVVLGIGMSLVPILVTTKARLGTLFLSDIARIMTFLSDDWPLENLLMWIQIQSVGRFSKARREERFQPRYPKSREDVRALSVIRLNSCNLTGEYIVFLNHTIFTLVMN